MTDKLNQALGLRDIEEEYDHVEMVETPETDNRDFDFTRDILYESVRKSLDAIEDFTSIAKQSQNARDYEVLNSLIKTLADISNDISDLKVKKQKYEETSKKNNPSSDKVVNNNFFVGSTAELQKMIEESNDRK